MDHKSHAMVHNPHAVDHNSHAIDHNSQEDGEERPDLDMELSIVKLTSPVGKKQNQRYG
jgi:hypothetical protein